MLTSTMTSSQQGCLELYYHRCEATGGRHRHQHDAHQINITLAGTTDVDWWTATDGDVHLQARGGDIIVNPAEEMHAGAWSGTWERIGFYVNRQLTSAIADELDIPRDSAIAPVYQGSDPAIYSLSRALLPEIESDPLACRLYAETLANFLAIRLLQGRIQSRFAGAAAPRLSAAHLRKITGFISAHLDQNLSVSELASIVYLSAFHFSRRFRASMGITPYQYVTTRRIELAKQLLSATRLPIIDISCRTGFSSQSHLCSRFKQWVGTTPKLYRENC
jgi:AraC family transcriptional regulator